MRYAILGILMLASLGAGPATQPTAEEFAVRVAYEQMQAKQIQQQAEQIKGLAEKVKALSEEFAQAKAERDALLKQYDEDHKPTRRPQNEISEILATMPQAERGFWLAEKLEGRRIVVPCVFEEMQKNESRINPKPSFFLSVEVPAVIAGNFYIRPVLKIPITGSLAKQLEEIANLQKGQVVRLQGTLSKAALTGDFLEGELADCVLIKSDH